ncbi:ArsR family transcriptional regulator [Kiloniella litopenaei]|uniref:VpaChn25_0724 family phage protein n=1 Tax=Kiloniella litopenaei TaxID=1549748 RepID=UPI003BAB5EFD
MSMEEIRREHWRIAILRLLKDGGNTANSSVLYDALPKLGLNPSRDQLNSELAWLSDQGLVLLKTLHNLLVATITIRGLDVAQGRASVPGVKSPSPEV